MRIPLAAFLLLVVAGCSAERAKEPAAAQPVVQAQPSVPKESPVKEPAAAAARTQVATFAGGCYWCIEAVFEQMPGVTDAKSGFMGGNVPNPTYDQVCDHLTGHAEVVQVTFDPSKTTYEALLDTFWHAHDPTTLNRQGPDAGDQYRSAIYYHSPEQKAAAEASLATAAKQFKSMIVTEITEASAFFPAPEDHQDYYVNNKEQGYCRAIIKPKLKKLGLKE